MLNIPRLLVCAGIAAGQLLRCQDGIARLISKAPTVASGRVVDGNGMPVPNARVDHLAVMRGSNIEQASIVTDTEGRFRFETHSPTVVFRKQGFESVLLETSGSLSDIQISMKPATVDVLPVCTPPELKGLGLLRFPNTKHVGAGRIGGSIDATEQTFSVREKRKVWTMIHGAGPSWGGPLPRSREVWSAADYKETWLRHATEYVIDARGTTRDGKRWRSLSLEGESAFYFDVPETVAEAFNLMFDRVCAPR